MNALLLGGGGFDGLVQLPVIEHLMESSNYDLVCGISVGAINALFVSQNDVETLKSVWTNLSEGSTWTGVKGVMNLAFHRGKGIYSLRPLAAKLLRHINPSKMRIPVEIGVTVEKTGEHEILRFDSNSAVHDVVDAAIGSSCIAGLIEPWEINMQGEKVWVRDGGHGRFIPKLSEDVKWSKIDVVLSRPLTKDSRPPMSWLDSICWAIEIHMMTNLNIDMSSLRWLSQKSEVCIYSPNELLSGLLDSSKNSMKKRLEMGKNMIKNPFRLSKKDTIESYETCTVRSDLVEEKCVELSL